MRREQQILRVNYATSGLEETEMKDAIAFNIDT